MEIICVICKHTDKTEEQRERHVKTAEHIRNDEIYTMGLEHGQQHGNKAIAKLRGALESAMKELEWLDENAEVSISKVYQYKEIGVDRKAARSILAETESK